MNSDQPCPPPPPAATTGLSSFASLLSSPACGGGGGGKGAAPPPFAAPGSTSRVTIEQSVGGGPPDPASLWRPVTFEHTLRPSWTKEKCFGCQYGMVDFSDSSQPALRGLWELFRENYGSEMTNRQIAKLMSSYHEEYIRKPMIEQGHAIPKWTAEQVLEHIEVHILEPTVHASTSIQELKQIARWLRDQVRVRHIDNGTMRVDLKVVRSLLDVEKQIQLLYSARPSKQLFYSDRFKLDERRANQGT